METCWVLSDASFTFWGWMGFLALLNLHKVNKVQLSFQARIITIHHKGKDVTNGMANVGFQPQPQNL